MIAIENVRLFDEVQARTRELSESLEQQTATSEVLQVISSSPGELEPVFEAMLANAVRICEAKFGVLFRYGDDAFRAALPRSTCRPHSPSFAGAASFRPDVEPALAGSPLQRRVVIEGNCPERRCFIGSQSPDLRVSTREHGRLLPCRCSRKTS